MNREGAKQAIKEGKKVTHEYFSDKEFVMKHEEEGFLLFEDGVKQSESEFWLMRSQKEWEEGWEIMPAQESEGVAVQLIEQAKKLEAYHLAVTRQYPTNYIQKMQPYVNLIIAYKKKHKVKSNIEAAIGLSQQTKNSAQQIMFLASGVEMLKNEK